MTRGAEPTRARPRRCRPRAGYVVSHAGGLAAHRPVAVTYGDDPLDVVRDVVTTLARGAHAAELSGIPPERILIDPTLDFGKTTQHSLEVLRHTADVAALGYPVLQALSRKDFVGESLDLPPEERLEGSLAATAIAAWLGATVFRAHDVRATREWLTWSPRSGEIDRLYTRRGVPDTEIRRTPDGFANCPRFQQDDPRVAC